MNRLDNESVDLKFNLMTSTMLAVGLLLNPTTTPVFSQEGSVSIAPGAADPNNDQSFDPPQI